MVFYSFNMEALAKSEKVKISGDVDDTEYNELTANYLVFIL